MIGNKNLNGLPSVFFLYWSAVNSPLEREISVLVARSIPVK